MENLNDKVRNEKKVDLAEFLLKKQIRFAELTIHQQTTQKKGVSHFAVIYVPAEDDAKDIVGRVGCKDSATFSATGKVLPARIYDMNVRERFTKF